MLAHQVAGKAVRDSLFLSNYPASDLPKVVIAAAAVTVALVLIFARAMRRFGPQRLVPAGFFISSMAHVAEYRLTTGNPALWCVLIYFHVVGGAILLSGFWSLMAESFDPHSAKQIFGRITAAGTLGGIIGGLMAERIAAVFSADGVLLLLAALHLACSGVLGSLQRVGPGSPRTDPRELISPVELFRRAPYLSAIAVVVLAGTSAAAILDYLFKAGAGAAFGKGAPLLRFFAVFYTCTQILTFFTQTFLAPRSLRRIGIGRTISTLPLGVGAGALGALLAPIFPVFTVLRSLESGLRGSLLSRRLRAVVHTGSRGHKACSQNSDRRRLRPRRRCAGQRDRAAHAVVRGIVYSLWAAGCHARPGGGGPLGLTAAGCGLLRTPATTAHRPRRGT